MLGPSLLSDAAQGVIIGVCLALTLLGTVAAALLH
jgi:hypothetical protein